MGIHHDTIVMTLSFGDDETELQADVIYTFTPGAPATGPSYASGGDPAVDPEIDIQSATITFGEPGDQVRNLECPFWLLGIMRRSQTVNEQLLQSVADGPDPDDARQARIDDEADRHRLEQVEGIDI